MKEIKIVEKGENFTMVNVGKLNEIKEYELPMGNFSIPGNIKSRYPQLFPLYEEIYLHKDRTYWKQLEQEAAKMAQEAQCKYVDNELPYERSTKGHPSIVNYLYHEEIRGSGNTGKRNVVQ